MEIRRLLQRIFDAPFRESKQLQEDNILSQKLLSKWWRHKMQRLKGWKMLTEGLVFYDGTSGHPRRRPAGPLVEAMVRRFATQLGASSSNIQVTVTGEGTVTGTVHLSLDCDISVDVFLAQNDHQRGVASHSEATG